MLAEGHTIPVAWDGTDAGSAPASTRPWRPGSPCRRPGGTPAALCALAAEILPRHQGRGLSAAVLRAMAGLAADGGLTT